MPHNELETSDQRILVVDDEETNVLLLQRVLTWAGFTNVRATSSGHEALYVFNDFDPDLVILDLHMPGMDGYQVLTELRNREADDSFLPILAYTADVTREARERALSMGASDFLTKPGERTEIKLRIRNLLSIRMLQNRLRNTNAELDLKVKQRTRELEAAQVEIIHRLAMAGEFRDEDTGEHTVRVGELAALVAGQLQFDPERVALILLAARLHDLGKVGVSDLILRKPGKLAPAEYELMKQHTLFGAQILSKGTSPLLRMAELIAVSHHERFDGTGYPQGLAGEAIPIEGRIVAVADVFDALTHERPYKPAWDTERAIAEIKSGSGTQFDPKVVKAFLFVVEGLGKQAA